MDANALFIAVLAIRPALGLVTWARLVVAQVEDGSRTSCSFEAWPRAAT